MHFYQHVGIGRDEHGQGEHTGRRHQAGRAQESFGASDHDLPERAARPAYRHQCGTPVRSTRGGRPREVDDFVVEDAQPIGADLLATVNGRPVCARRTGVTRRFVQPRRHLYLFFTFITLLQHYSSSSQLSKSESSEYSTALRSLLFSGGISFFSSYVSGQEHANVRSTNSYDQTYITAQPCTQSLS